MRKDALRTIQRNERILARLKKPLKIDKTKNSADEVFYCSACGSPVVKSLAGMRRHAAIKKSELCQAAMNQSSVQ